MMAKCTVVMPIYNKEEFLREAIESVLKQKCNFSIELILADDCSIDGSYEIALSYEKRYPQRIKVLGSDKNNGLLSNDNRVFENMKTEYFCVLDPDDYWIDENFLQKAVSFLDRNTEYVCYSSNTVIVEEGKKNRAFITTNLESYVTQSIQDYLNNNAIIPHTTAAVFRNVIYKNGVPEIIKNAVGSVSEASYRGDHGRFVIHLKYGSAMFINEFVGVYRIHKSGIWSGAKQIHRDLIGAQAIFEYSDFYEKKYEDQFRKLAVPYYNNILKEKNRMEQMGEVLCEEDALIFQSVEKKMQENKIMNYEIEKKIRKLETIQIETYKLQKEALWANVFHDTIRGSEWLSDSISLSPGRWALGYPALYVLYRVLDEVKPTSILELGLGQSTKIIGNYVNYKKNKDNECYHYVVEHDEAWIKFFRKNNKLENTKIMQMNMVEEEFNVSTIGKIKVNTYERFQEKLSGKKFDVILIDAPIGSHEYSRIDIVNILPSCLSDKEFVIFMDDVERLGEQRTIMLIRSILEENGIEYSLGVYEGEKSTALLTSKDLSFLTSL